MRLAFDRAHGIKDRETFAQKFLETVRRPVIGKAAEDQRATGGDLNRVELGIELARRDPEHFRTHRNSDGATIFVVTPMVKAANHRAVASILGSQRERAMRAAVLKSSDGVAESLHEDRTAAQRGANPIAVVLDVVSDAEDCPEMAKP